MHRILTRAVVVPAIAALALAGAVASGSAVTSALPSTELPSTELPSTEPTTDPAAQSPVTRAQSLPGGSTLSWHADGSVSVTDARGHVRPLPLPRAAGRSGLGTTFGAPDSAIAARASARSYTVGSATTGGTPAMIQPMNTGGIPLPKANAATAQKQTTQAPNSSSDSTIPGNDGLDSSFQSSLNANGVDAVGTFADAQKYLHALPGAGQIITNVSIGDLTDQAMADAGDAYVQQNGPTTIIKGGQRYLDIPTMPLIPTYVADAAGRLNPTGSAEGQDPTLGEVLLDFSMMAPLPHDRQRPGATGSGLTDLLGIAPGSEYRLVVPRVPDAAGIAAALLAAAHQSPRPSVITASLGFGTDGTLGFPGRWIEDEPSLRSALASIVASGIAVVVSSNDGTRLALPVSVGPDGGSTPTETTTRASAQTNIIDVQATTVPTEVVDDGVIAAGSTTVDDVLSSDDIRTAAYPTTRYNGATAYSSGFGSRVDLSAPGDNLPSFQHAAGPTSTARTVGVVLNGGTSASAPEIAAAMADALQAAAATGTTLKPAALRQLLESTARTVTQTPQADQNLNVGPQLDVTRAFEKILSKKYDIPTRAVRMSVAERQLIPTVSGTTFEEDTNPDAVDLAGPADGNGQPSGQNAVSPITFGLDLTGSTQGLTYRLSAGHLALDLAVPSVRVLPKELLAAAGLPLTSTTNDRRVTVTMSAIRGTHVVASQARTLTFLADDGTYEQAQAPTAPGHVALGRDVVVRYDLTGVRGVSDPKLVLSSVGHFTPSAGVDAFNVAWSTPLASLKGTVTIPASALTSGGGGLYGVGLQTAMYGTLPGYGDFRAVTVGAQADQRPAPVVVSGAHAVDVTHAAPTVRVTWDARSVAQADGALLEIMAPAPSLYGSINTVTNQNGSKRDGDGFNHVSTATVPLGSTHGSATIDLAKLGVTTGLQYPVRVLATMAGQPIGQASPTSLLQYRDGAQVNGTVEGFTIAGNRALISTDTFGGASGVDLVDSATVPYSLAAGTLGTPIDNGADPSLQDVVGTDPGSGNALIVRSPYVAGTWQIQVVNTHTGAMLASTPVDSLPGLTPGSSYIGGGIVDQKRRRGAVEIYDAGTGHSLLYWVDMTVGAVDGPIVLNPNNPGRTASNLAIDRATGAVFATTTGTLGPCLSGRVSYWTVKASIEARTVTPITTMPICTAAVAPDNTGGTLYVAVGAAQPYGGPFPTSGFLSVNQTTMVPGPQQDIGTRGPEWLSYDATNQVLVETSIYESGVETDNNAMSEVTVIDPHTGAVLSRKPIVNVTSSTVTGSNFDFTSRQGLYLDPATRTGWVIDAVGTGLTRFSY